MIRLDKELLKEGVYAVLQTRIKRLVGALKGVQYATRLVKDLSKILGPAVIGMVIVAYGLTYSW